MARRIRYHDLFDCDVREAANWYDERAAGLGFSFVEIVHARIEEILSDPERFGLLDQEIRYSQVDRFPYVILFHVTEDEVFFVGVLHTARSMKKWRRLR